MYTSASKVLVIISLEDTIIKLMSCLDRISRVRGEYKPSFINDEMETYMGELLQRLTNIYLVNK